MTDKKPHLRPGLTEDQVRKSRREVDKAYKLLSKMRGKWKVWWN